MRHQVLRVLLFCHSSPKVRSPCLRENHTGAKHPFYLELQVRHTGLCTDPQSSVGKLLQHTTPTLLSKESWSHLHCSATAAIPPTAPAQPFRISASCVQFCSKRLIPDSLVTTTASFAFTFSPVQSRML